MASVIETKNKSTKKRYEKRIYDIYNKSLLTKTIELPMNAVGDDIKIKLEQKIKYTIEGSCIAEGYVKPNSVKVLTYSSGQIYDGNKIHFEVVFECEICLPVEGMLIEAVAVNITKAGIRAEIKKDELDSTSPVVIFLARDHHYEQEYFSSIKQDNLIKVKVIGQRFELKDKYISIIAQLIEPKKIKVAKKPKLVLKTT
jgi:DNA-directed RNA polymerase subunit E'/Rpb7|tara:strand:+ start:859 stop:1455 length:597 start_codon:yes stop_codon:yes gene_type:complete